MRKLRKKGENKKISYKKPGLKEEKLFIFTRIKRAFDQGYDLFLAMDPREES